jgi:hypothetical protein
MTFEEIIGKMRKSEEEINLIVISQGTQVAMILQQICGVWNKIKIKRIKSGECRVKDDKMRWEWIWKQIEFDKKAVARMSGYRGDKIQDYIDILINMRLIYPDGTIAEMVKQALLEQVKNSLGL